MAVVYSVYLVASFVLTAKAFSMMNCCGSLCCCSIAVEGVLCPWLCCFVLICAVDELTTDLND